jgi:hypothetical protein
MSIALITILSFLLTTLDVTVGQPVVGTASAGPYHLCAGFRCAANAYDVFLPAVLREA